MAEVVGIVNVKTPELDNLYKAVANGTEQCAICGNLKTHRSSCTLDELYQSSKSCVLCRVLAEGILTQLFPLRQSDALYEDEVGISPHTHRKRHSFISLVKSAQHRQRSNSRPVASRLKRDVVWGTVFDKSGTILVTHQSMFYALRDLTVRIDLSHGRLEKIRVSNWNWDLDEEGERPYEAPELFGLEFIEASEPLKGLFPAPFHQDRRKLESEIRPADVLNTIRGWIRDCTYSHVGCDNNPSAELPSRLIHISPDGSIRLCNTSGMQGKYLTLSYCWGASTAFMTTTINIADQMAGIKHEYLPKTFQDVVTIAKGLFVQYIWIDSLCIIQDSPSDWDVESSRMAGIYANAFLNISAAAAADPHGGCFGHRDREDGSRADILNCCNMPPILHPFPYSARLDVFQDSQKVGDILVREALLHNKLDIAAIDHGDDPRSALFRRAWVFQERLLSQRTVHFAMEEIFWECRSGARCECGTLRTTSRDLELDSFVDGNFKLYFTRALTRHCSGRQQLRFSELRKLWHIVVELYTSLQLSFEKDRLTALSALAQAIQCDDLGVYIAGLWSNDLPQALTWRPASKTGHRVVPYRAPSWSWGSVEVDITYNSTMGIRRPLSEYEPPLMKVSASVLAFSIETATANEYSNLKSASIRLSAPVTPALLCKNHEYLRQTWVDSEWILQSNGLILGFQPDIASDFEDVESMACITVLLGENEERVFSALALRECSDREGVYERVGMMMGHKSEYKDYSREQLDGEHKLSWQDWVSRLHMTFNSWFEDADTLKIMIV